MSNRNSIALRPRSITPAIQNDQCDRAFNFRVLKVHRRNHSIINNSARQDTEILTIALVAGRIAQVAGGIAQVAGRSARLTDRIARVAGRSARLTDRIALVAVRIA